MFADNSPPRTLAIIVIAAALPLVVGYLATIFGLIQLISPLAGLSAIPVAVFFYQVIILILKVCC